VRARREAGCRGWRARLGCGLWVGHGATGATSTSVGGGGAIAGELELTGALTNGVSGLGPRWE
jgi:hypothetical protein